MNVFLWALGGVLLVGLACGLMLGGGKGALAIAVVLAIGLGIAIATVGTGAILIAAYAGGPVVVAAAIGLAAGSALRRKQ